MDKTEHLYKELKNKVKELVVFMKENGIENADLSIEDILKTTICNVKYSKGDDIVNEFMYFFDNEEVDNKKIIQSEVLSFEVEEKVQVKDKIDNKEESKDKKNTINLKEEALIQEDTIASILKEFNVIK